MLAHDEDYAQVRNHVGYNKGDTIKAIRIGPLDYWPQHDANWIYKSLGRYTRQLEEIHGIKYDDLDDPNGKGDEVEYNLTLEDLEQLEWGQRREVNTRNGPKYVSRAINLPTDPFELRCFWDAFWQLYNSKKNYIKWTLGISYEAPNRWNNQTTSLCLWEDRDVVDSQEDEEEGIFNPDLYEVEYKHKLLEYQPLHVKKLLHAYHTNDHKVLDGSDAGTGKSYTLIATALQLGKRMFIVCPKSVIASWIKAMKHFGIPESEINKEDGKHFIVNYGHLRFGKLIHTRFSKRTKYYRKYGIPKRMYDSVKNPYITKYGRREYEWHLSDDFLLVYDEIHYCKNIKTSNAATLIAAKQANCNIIGLSATIGADPIKLRTVAYMIGLYQGIKGFWDWAREHGCGNYGWNGSLEFTKNKQTAQFHMKQIHKDIFHNNQRGARMRISELGDLFPETQITAELYNMDNNSKIQKAYTKMEEELRELREKEDRDYSNILTTILRGRQKVELLKTPTFIELAEDYMSSGNSVVLFVNFNDTLNKIAEHFGEDNEPYPCVIRGGQSQEERNHWIDEFQSNNRSLIICNINAGGIGISLHDLSGFHPRVALLSPNFSAQSLIQALGRVHRGGGKSKSIQRIIFCENTIEERIHESLERKIMNINMLNDGDLVDGIDITPEDFKDYHTVRKDIQELLESSENIEEKSGEWAKKYNIKLDNKLKLII